MEWSLPDGRLAQQMGLFEAKAFYFFPYIGISVEVWMG
jgi:hypothetical protein